MDQEPSAVRWIAARTIDAPADRVFRTVVDPEEFHRAIPDCVKVGDSPYCER